MLSSLWARWSWWGDVAEDEDEETQFVVEPPVPPGLGQLTSAQRELCDRLEVDPDLLSAAAELDVPVPEDTFLFQEDQLVGQAQYLVGQLFSTEIHD